MTKLQFLLSLHDKLSSLAESDAEERLHFYTEMIEDRMEEGLSEEDAVAAVGSADEIAAQILADFPALPPVPEKTVPEKPARKKRRNAWEIVLLILGAPLWLPLLIAAFSVLLSLYVSLWAVIVSLWAVFASVIGCTLAGMAAGIGFVLGGHPFSGVALFGAGLVCAGFSVFLVYGCKWITQSTARLTKRAVCRNKSIREAKEEA